ncbi:triacylglycerol lipase [Ancylostoma ceylanicum]|uniref:Triacylglycerol lipase n=1 Tax=Ancylostoma ceylanicum TaxID=53326 RepID=A0A0D6LZT4_9BILA|nr:triacylglycerol lipase [Ancylostoma ceylanicum]
MAFSADLSVLTIFGGLEKLFYPLENWRHKGNVSPFLKQAFESLWKGVMENFFRQIVEEPKNQEVLITGHSFGGGLAALIAYDIVREGLINKDNVTLITLGQSLVGDKNFSKALEEQVKDSFRVVCKDNCIPHMPSQACGYENIGREKWEFCKDGS